MKSEQYLGKDFLPVRLFVPYLFEMEIYLHICNEKKIQP